MTTAEASTHCGSPVQLATSTLALASPLITPLLQCLPEPPSVNGRREPSPVQAPLLTAGGGNRSLHSFVLRRDSWPGAQATTTGIPSVAALQRLAGRFARC